ncbi:hypothetical protein C8J57DRAFT_1526786 [Mycena rebaudengoi]|nr:hypothetical protein C8J57DRAFT_1526786 [Mycena rebaudengoi]
MLKDMPLPVQHLSFINIFTLDAINPSLPLFQTLTHLDMFAGIEGQPLDFQFAQLPALTHLGTHGDRRPPIDADPRFVMMAGNVFPLHQYVAASA